MEKFDSVVPADQSLFAKNFQFQEPLIGSVDQNKELDLELEWIQEPVVFETTVDLGHKEGYVKAIKGFARNLDKESGRKLECLADSIHGSSSSYFFDVLDPSHCICLLLSKNHGVQLGERWK